MKKLILAAIVLFVCIAYQNVYSVGANDCYAACKGEPNCNYKCYEKFNHCFAACSLGAHRGGLDCTKDCSESGSY